MEKYYPLLRRSALFSGLEEGEIRSVLSCLGARTAEYGRGEYLLREGERAAAVGLLLTGEALIVQEDFWGNRNIMDRAEPGDLFAEAFACAGQAALTVSVTASEPCRVLWMDVERILTTCPTACAHHSRMIRGLLSDLARKNLRFADKLTHMGRRTTREKLLSYLSAQARLQGASAFDIPFTRQQLADYLSVERSAMSAQLCRLRDEGVLEFRRSHFALKNA